jgi:hypothetical protein
VPELEAELAPVAVKTSVRNLITDCGGDRRWRLRSSGGESRDVCVCRSASVDGTVVGRWRKWAHP